MALLDRLRMGLVLTKDSILLMRHYPKLTLFPIISGGCGLIFLALVLGLTFGFMAIDPRGGALVGFFFIYLGLTFISSFFAAGLVHETRSVLNGQEPSIRAGLTGAWSVKSKIGIWSIISATIGIILSGIENSDSRGAQVFGALFGLAWTLMTFFIIPVIVFEKPSFRGMFEQSARTFRHTWGETPISLFGVQIISMIIVIPMFILAVVLYSVLPVVAIAIALLGVLFSYLVGQTLQGIVKTVVYMYAIDGRSPTEFDNIDFDQLAKA